MLDPIDPRCPAHPVTFTVPATLDSAEHVSHVVMQMARDMGKSAAEELQVGSDVFQRFSTYVMERPVKTSRVQCHIACTSEGEFELSLSEAA